MEHGTGPFNYYMTHNTLKSMNSTHFNQYAFGLILDSPNVFHCEPIPLVDPTAHLTVELGEDPPLSIHDHLLHSVLQPPPLELAGHQLVGTHDGACSLLHIEVHWGAWERKGIGVCRGGVQGEGCRGGVCVCMCVRVCVGF